ncbi:hypothetical protein HanIR_Chr12g0609681 [Helianthus annuus]|nr:hypothetical protein HanIR_Chr12g0609681 [Helianthus annuus]
MGQTPSALGVGAPFKKLGRDRCRIQLKTTLRSPSTFFTRKHTPRYFMRKHMHFIFHNYPCFLWVYMSVKHGLETRNLNKWSHDRPCFLLVSINLNDFILIFH